MKTELKTYSVEQIVEGFEYSELEGKGLFGLAQRLTIQPEYQRHFIYAHENKEAAVIHSLLKKYPLGLFYFNRASNGQLEVLDGQQRITSIGRFVTGKFAIRDEGSMEQYFVGLAKDKQDLILQSKILVYECEGTESEIKEWFRTINIAGSPLSNQELLNAVYSGPFVTAGKEEFSNKQNSNIQKWDSYIKGSIVRQEFWERALAWVSKSDQNIAEYMSEHRNDEDIAEVKSYFNLVIDWVSAVFIDVDKTMKGLDWGALYDKYHSEIYDPDEVSEKVQRLLSDPFVENKRGIFEYILGGEKQKNLLNIRIFNDTIKRKVYEQQTKEAKNKGKSNCSYCSLGHNEVKSKIWAISDMEADHVTAWSKAGESNIENCEMLCKSHNRAKGNK